MKEVVTTITGWCDGEHAERVPATIERTIKIDFDDFVEIDLCDDCDVVIQVVQKLLENGMGVGLRAKQKPKTKPVAESHPCPICSTVSVSRGGLAAHLKKKHDLTFGQLKALSEEEIAGRRAFNLIELSLP